MEEASSPSSPSYPGAVTVFEFLDLEILIEMCGEDALKNDPDELIDPEDQEGANGEKEGNCCSSVSGAQDRLSYGYNPSQPEVRPRGTILERANSISKFWDQFRVYVDESAKATHVAFRRSIFGDDGRKVSKTRFMETSKVFKVLWEASIELLSDLIAECCQPPDQALAGQPTCCPETSDENEPFRTKLSQQSVEIFHTIIDIVRALDKAVPGSRSLSAQKIALALEKVPKHLQPDLVSLVPRLVKPSEHLQAADILLEHLQKPDAQSPFRLQVFSALRQLDCGNELWEHISQRSFELLGDSNDENLVPAIDFVLEAALQGKNLPAAAQILSLQILSQRREAERQLERVRSEHDGEVKAIEAEKKRLQDHLSKAEGELAQLNSWKQDELLRIIEKKNALEESLKNAEAAKKRSEEKLEHFVTEEKSRNSFLEETILRLTQTLEQTEREKKEKEDHAAQCQAETDRMKSQLQACQQKIQSQKGRIAQLTETLRQTQGEKHEKEACIDTMKSQLQACQSELKEEKERLARAEKELSEQGREAKITVDVSSSSDDGSDSSEISHGAEWPGLSMPKTMARFLIVVMGLMQLRFEPSWKPALKSGLTYYDAIFIAAFYVTIVMGLSQRRYTFFNRLRRRRYVGAAAKALVVLAATRVSGLSVSLFDDDVFKLTNKDRVWLITSTAIFQIQMYLIFIYQRATADFDIVDLGLSLVLSSVTIFLKGPKIFKELLIEGINWVALILNYVLKAARET